MRRVSGCRTAPEVVLFDLGGVLMDFRGLHRLAELCGEEESPALRSRWLAAEPVQAFERGACDADEFARSIVHDWGLKLAPREFLDDFAGWSAGPFPGAVDLLRRLHGTISMGCLSNTNAVHWQRHLDHWGLVQYFDRTFTSHELGMTKPDPAVFQHVVRTIGTAPDGILLLDDSAEHVHAARASGMRAEQVQGMYEVRVVLGSVLDPDSTAGRALRSGSSHDRGPVASPPQASARRVSR